MRVLIKNGTVVTESGEFSADILIEDEKIAGLGKCFDEIRVDKVISADGMYVLPGGVDQHTHYAGINSDGVTECSGYDTTYAALIGGTTTTVDFCPNEKDMGMLDSIRHRIEVRAKGKVCTDFGIHAQCTQARENMFDEIRRLPELGVSTMKLFMAFKPTSQYMDDGIIFQSMRACRDAGVTMYLHCENADLLNVLRDEAAKAGHLSPHYHYLTRPPYVEAEATARAIALADAAGCPLCVVHVSCREAGEHVAAARARGQRVIGETCNHYLSLDQSLMDDPAFERACRWVCSPPIRDQAQREYLWEGVRNDVFSLVSSDHVGIPLSQKLWGINDFREIPNGCPGAPNRLSNLWTDGVAKGRITRQRLAEVFAANPAKLCGIYPQKGTIAVGSDADLVLWDPAYRGVVDNESCPSGVDYNICEGMERIGRAEKVLLRGQVVVEDGRFVGELGCGRFIPGKAYGLAYTL